jgi:DNA recombination protein RmuC
VDAIAIGLALLGVMLGLAAGWLLRGRDIANLAAERDARTEEFRAAIRDLAGAEARAEAAAALAEERAVALAETQETLDAVRDEREAARTQLAKLTAQAEAFEARLAEFRDAKEAMAHQFSDVAGKLLNDAQQKFLQRADERFRESEELARRNLNAVLQPVGERLSLYEASVKAVEAERASAFDQLKGQLAELRQGQEKVSSEAARLVNALRNAPKARGRWGEQQLRNVLESCGLAEHCDFETEVSVGTEDGRLRPDVIIRIPGGRTLIVDAKVSLNAYQDAFEAEDEGGRAAGLAAHAAAIRAHMKALGDKAYQAQFKETLDFVVMFVPGEHFVSAALEQDAKLWDDAFERRVLIATPTNLVAIAKTIASIWRQEKLARDAAEIGRLGKELYERLAKAAGDLRKVGAGLTSAVNNYNAFVSSFESRALVTARKFRDLNVDTGAREIEEAAPVEALARYGDEALIEARAAE